MENLDRKIKGRIKKGVFSSKTEQFNDLDCSVLLK